MQDSSKRGVSMQASNSFRKILVANRGAIARRVIRACNELGVASVAVYSEADAAAPYLSEASEAWPLPGETALDTYLNQDALLEAARRANVDAIHPGYGFLAEHEGFARRVIESGLTFIGPAPDLIATLGDKVRARELMVEHGFPVFPGSGLITSLEAARVVAAELGYPLLVKPSGGGGGMGMEIVMDPQDLEAAVTRARVVAGGAFANSAVYLERYVTSARHIEYQLLGDADRVVHAFERECSVQRRNQKLIEESPAPGIDAHRLGDIAATAARVAQAIGYTNVGTVETLMNANGEVGFLEVNTRIQVEHGVTEAVTGLDLVQMQIQLAQGGSVPHEIHRSGYAMEARIYAEHPVTMLPSTGRLTAFEVPGMYGVRVETGYARGQTVTPFYDPMLAKVIATGSTREMAIGRLAVALRAFDIQGVDTNRDLLHKVLMNEDFLDARLDTGLLSRIMDG